MNTIIEHRSCTCEDRPACGCDNGAFEVEVDEFPIENDGWDDDEVPESEDDGQPDEMKEWQDFEGPQEDQYLDASWEDRFEVEMDD